MGWCLQQNAWMWVENQNQVGLRQTQPCTDITIQASPCSRRTEQPISRTPLVCHLSVPVRFFSDTQTRKPRFGWPRHRHLGAARREHAHDLGQAGGLPAAHGAREVGKVVGRNLLQRAPLRCAELLHDEAVVPALQRAAPGQHMPCKRTRKKNQEFLDGFQRVNSTVSALCEISTRASQHTCTMELCDISALSALCHRTARKQHKQNLQDNPDIHPLPKKLMQRTVLQN